MNRLAGLMLACLCGGSSAQDVVINEFMAANATTHTNKLDGYSDWIELHNAGTFAVDLTGWALTDDSGDLAKWVFPGGVPGSQTRC